MGLEQFITDVIVSKSSIYKLSAYMIWMMMCQSFGTGRVEFTGRHRNTLRLLFHIYTV